MLVVLPIFLSAPVSSPESGKVVRKLQHAVVPCAYEETDLTPTGMLLWELGALVRLLEGDLRLLSSSLEDVKNETSVVCAAPFEHSNCKFHWNFFVGWANVRHCDKTGGCSLVVLWQLSMLAFSNMSFLTNFDMYLALMRELIEILFDLLKWCCEEKSN